MGHLDAMRMLVDTGIAVDICTKAQKTPLALASREGKVEVGRFLIDRGADVNAQDEQSRFPLHFATQFGHFDVTKLLLDHGVDSNVQKVNLWGPLHLASAHGHLEVVELLFQCGARIDVYYLRLISSEKRHFIPARNWRVEIARLLIEHRANLHTVPPITTVGRRCTRHRDVDTSKL